MKRTFIYPVSLSLLLAVSPTYGEQWERQQTARAMAPTAAMSTGMVNHNWYAIESNRRRHLERGMDRDPVFDIESLPPTAAGPRAHRRMDMDWTTVHTHRRMHFEHNL